MSETLYLKVISEIRGTEKNTLNEKFIILFLCSFASCTLFLATWSYAIIFISYEMEWKKSSGKLRMRKAHIKVLFDSFFFVICGSEYVFKVGYCVSAIL